MRRFVSGLIIRLIVKIVLCRNDELRQINEDLARIKNEATAAPEVGGHDE
ncbi:MAG: hypothetical protein ACYTEQ_19690 [Planctomycetota bacterium]|jgi:hypothetical protein